MSRFSTGLLVLALTSCGLYAQSVSQITGTIRDASGLAVPSAEVTATQTGTGLVRTAASSADGTYVLPSLPIGPYRIEVKKEGFSTYVQNGVVLQVDTAPTVDATLKVGAVSEQVSVEAAAAMVETHSTGVGQVVNQQQVVDLPLNGRQVTQLITLAGGATTAPAAYGGTPASGNLVSSKNYPNEALVSIAGGALNGVTYLMDGGTHNDPFNNLNLPLPFPDAVQEFKVETSALPAQYGQHSAGAVNVVTKSGTNEFHGDAFEFVRNYDFNARDFFAPVRDNLKRNQFGGTIGGPIKKNKLFFFLGYQDTIVRSAPAASIANVPTPPMLKGDMTAYEHNCFPAGPQTLKAPYVNNVLPASLVSPQAVKMSSFFPAGPGDCGLTTYTLIANQTEHNGLAKIDYQLSSKQSIFGRYYVTHSLVPSSFTGTELSVLNAGTDDEVNSVVLGHTYILGPNALNSFRATANRVGITKFQVPILTASGIGVQNIYEPLPNYSNINITGDFNSAGGFATPGLVATTTYQASDDFSLIKGAHQLQFGGTYIRPGQNSTFCVYCDGLFTFNGQATGSAFGDFFAGSLDTFNDASISHDNERWNYFGLYAQDTWKISSHLTANIGLRWEPYLAGRILNGWVTHFNQANFDAGTHSTVYPNGPAGTLFPGDAGFDTGSRPNKTSWNDWAPRIGLAFDPMGDGRTVIRASWGLFYDMPHTLFYYNYSSEPPWGEAIALTNPPGGFANPWLGYPGGNPYPVNLGPSFTFPTAGYYETVPLNVKVTYLEQWNLSVQKQIGASWLFKASYMGNNTVHLWTDHELNPAIYVPGNCAAGQYGLTVAGPCSTTATTQARRRLTQLNPTQGPLYGTLESLDDGGTGSYNALIVSAEHRLSKQFMVLANYTWSHCISDLVTSELSGPIYTNPANRRMDRGNCAQIDTRGNFNLSAVIQSPHLSSHFLQMVAGDWQLSPIVTAHTGGYFNVTTGVDNALNGIGGQRPNQLTSNVYCANQSITCWMNLAGTFGSPAAGTFGNEGYNNLVGPGFFEVDVALSKRFRVRERQTVEIRAEAFNIQNRANFLNPTGAMNSSNFGKILTDVSPRIMQFAVKYAF
ncbi:MAG TPA: carboxypeptidase regulatory-like domain-containing protein [Bryobacteraceae bacterium]|nr:carboxypeptidase regulatory-like domain-containing protein [Bryobacteraceae bacterium]